MKNLSILITLVVLTFVSSCKKDEATTPTKSKTDIITAKVWIPNQVVALGALIAYQRGGKASDNLFDLDKVSLSFKADGSLSGVDNTGKTLSGAKWSFSTDETKIIISGTGIVGFDGEALIIQLTETNFDVKGKATVQGQSVDATLKLTPQ
jgi:hypothetical protein